MSSRDARRVLLVDDDPEVLTVLEEWLARDERAFEVLTAEDAAAALELLDDAGPIDCVVSDHVMGERSGLDLLRDVRERDPELPFVLFTGKGSEELASEAISRGVTRYLTKRIDREGAAELIETVEEAVRTARHRERIREEIGLLDDAFEASPDLIVLLDTHGLPIYWNDAAQAATPLPLDRQTRVFEQFPPAVRDDVVEAFERVVEGEELTIRFPLGTDLERADPIEFTGVRLTDEDGETIGVCSIGRDLGHRADYQETLEALHRTTRSLLSAESREDVAEIVADATGHIVENPVCGVFLRSGDRFLTASVIERERENPPPRTSYRVDGDEPLPTVVRTGESVIVDDVSEIDDDRERGDLQKELILPLGDHGALMLARRQDRPFEPDTVALANLLAGNATAALNRHDRERRLEERASLLSTLLESTRSLIGAEDETAVATVVRDAATEMVGAPRVGVYCWNQSEGALDCGAASTALQSACTRLPTVGPGDGPVWQSFLESETRRFDGRPTGAGDATAAAERSTGSDRATGGDRSDHSPNGGAGGPGGGGGRAPAGDVHRSSRRTDGDTGPDGSLHPGAVSDTAGMPELNSGPGPSAGPNEGPSTGHGAGPSAGDGAGPSTDHSADGTGAAGAGTGRPETGFSGVAVPMADEGVIVAAGPDGVADAAVEYLEVLASNAASAIERSARLEQLRDQEQRLERQNEQLQRLNRLNSIIRTINAALVQADDRDAIERAVCRNLTTIEQYGFAWIGDVADGELAVSEFHGRGRSLLDDLGERVSEGGAATPAERAIESGDPAVVDDLVRSDEGPLRELALAREYHGVVSLPLVHRDERFGVLEVYADRPGVLDEEEVTVLAELADDIANAIHGIERHVAMLSARTVTLEFDLPARSGPLFHLARGVDRRLIVSRLLPGSGGSWRLFVEVDADAAADLIAVADGQVSVDAAGLLREGEQRAVVELTVDPGFVDVFGHSGAVVESVAVEPDGATLVVSLPASSAIREYVDRCRETLPELTLTRREAATPESAGATRPTEPLTDRQLEVLETAYVAGYFDWPRERTGEEIAADLDITGPTFQQHLRTGLDRLLGASLDEE